MLLWMSSLASAAAPAACTHTSISRLARLDGPTILVLGERKGSGTDLGRARRLVRALAEQGPVTVAMQAVRADAQATLDRLGQGELAVDQLDDELRWGETWGFSYAPYARLFALASPLVRFVGVGAPYTLPAEDVAVPPGYFQVLRGPMGENPVPTVMEERYAKFVAGADRTFAQGALKGWSGEGALVLIVDRFHVEGGLGVPWQLKEATDQPVRSALLADAQTVCYAGDQFLNLIPVAL
jgi:Haem-binding uptake, Tiki superfamily, ChaN